MSDRARSRLGWRPALALGVALAAATTPARAEWQVRRQSGTALREQAVRAIEAAPEDAGLAARVARTAPPDELAATLARLRADAGRAGAGFAPLLGYAQLLLAAGRAD